MKHYLVAVLLGISIGAMLPERALVAQTPAPSAVPAVPAPAAPALDELEQAWAQTLSVAQVRAVEACNELAQTKQFNALRAQTVQKIETRRPGYTLGADLSKPALVKKPAPAGTK